MASNQKIDESFQIGFKVSNDECKNLLTCWKAHELQF
jgi:hypothetical protein